MYLMFWPDRLVGSAENFSIHMLGEEDTCALFRCYLGNVFDEKDRLLRRAAAHVQAMLARAPDDDQSKIRIELTEEQEERFLALGEELNMSPNDLSAAIFVYYRWRYWREERRKPRKYTHGRQEGNTRRMTIALTERDYRRVFDMLEDCRQAFDVGEDRPDCASDLITEIIRNIDETGASVKLRQFRFRPELRESYAVFFEFDLDILAKIQRKLGTTDADVTLHSLIIHADSEGVFRD